MAKAINQNDLIDILNANIKATENILESVVKLADPKKIYMSKSWGVQYKTLLNVLNLLTDKKGIFFYFDDLYKKIKSLPNLNDNVIKSHIVSIIDYIDNISKLMDMMLLLQAVYPETSIDGTNQYMMNIMDLLSSSFNNINTSILNTINVKNLIELKYKLFLFKIIIKQLIKTILYIDKLIPSGSTDQIIKNLRDLNTAIKSIESILTSLKKINGLKLLPIRVKLINIIISSLCKILININQLYEDIGKNTTIIETLSMINTVIDIIKNIMDNIGRIKIILINKRIAIIINNLKYINKLINSVNSIIKIKPNTLRKLTIVNRILIVLKSIYINISLLLVFSPIALISIVLFPIFALSLLELNLILFVINHMKISKKTSINILILGSILLALVGISSIVVLLALMTYSVILSIPYILIYLTGLIAITAAIWIMLKIVNHLISLKTALGLIYLTGLILSLLGIGYILVILGALSIILTSQFISILKLIGVVGLIGLSMLALGAIFGLLNPLMSIIWIGIGSLAITIGLFLLLAGEIYLIQLLDLDIDLIKSNIKNVMSATFDVLNAIFGSVFDIEDKTNESPSFWDQVFNFLGGPALTLAKTLLSVPFLAAAVVAIGLVTFLAGELRLLQEIELDKDKIKTGVETVLNTASSVADLIFNSSFDTSTKEGDSSVLDKIIDFVGGPIKKLSGVLLSIPLLAASIGAVGLITFLAGELRLLQEINLNGETINKNVQAVLQVADEISKLIFKSTPTTDLIKANENDPWYKKIAKKAVNVTYNAAKSVGSAIKNTAGAMIASPVLLATSASVASVVAIANNLKTLNDITIDENTKSKAAKILEIANQMVSETLNIKKISITDLNRHSMMINNYIKFVDKINNVKVENLSKAANLFREMARLSESINGNFEGLAESLNEKIAPLLDELNEKLKKIPDKMDTTSKYIGQSIIDNANGFKGWDSDVIARNASNYTTGNAQEDDDRINQIKEAQERAAMEARAEETRITELLQNILNALVGEGAYSGVKIQ